MLMQINPIAISIGNLEIRWYAILILLGAIVGILLAQREASKKGISKDDIFDLAFWMLIFGILGARLYYVLFNLSSYKNILEVLAVWNGGLAIHGGITGGAITMLIFCKKKGLSFLTIADITMPSVMIAQAIGRWGNFINQEAHGPLTTLEFLRSIHLPNFIIDGMNINGIYYQPTFLYESLWCILGFIVLIVIRQFVKKLKTGQLTCIYFIWYGIGRFFIEGLRTDSLMIFNIKVAQLVSILTFIAGLVILIILGLRKEKTKKVKKNK